MYFCVINLNEIHKKNHKKSIILWVYNDFLKIPKMSAMLLNFSNLNGWDGETPEWNCMRALQTWIHLPVPLLVSFCVNAVLDSPSNISGRGKLSHAYTHSVLDSHHVFLNLLTQKFYCLPDNYQIIDSSLDDIIVSYLVDMN